jgi:hypothetical protein
MQPSLPFPTQVNAVPPGFKWSAQNAQKAAENNAFIRVGGDKTVTRRFLSGAERSWQKLNDPREANTVFSLEYRITGTPEDIRRALQLAGVTQQDIQAVLANAVTRDNYKTTKANEYNMETDRHKASKESKSENGGQYDLKQILWFAQNLKNAQIETSTGGQRLSVAGGRGGGGSIQEKVMNVGPGKIIDVSGMDLVTGKGIKTGNWPKTGKSGKAWAGNIPIMSNDPARYRRAIELVYGPEGLTKYGQQIDVVTNALQGGMQQALPTFQQQVSPRTVASPVRPLGSTLSQGPVFQPTVPQMGTPRGIGTLGGNQFPSMGTFGR